jgi:hypothetical protein
MRKRLKIDLYMPHLPLAVATKVAGSSTSKTARPSEPARYTAQRLAGGCVVYWLGRRELG